MPTSHHTYISDVIGLVRSLNPASVLDIGVGFGKWGHVFREYLDVMHGRPFKESWKVQIDGVEIFEKYIQAHQRHIYDEIFIDNIRTMSIRDYDLIFMSDVIEHIEKKEAVEVINKLCAHSKALILIVPIGTAWLNSQGKMYGNEHEAHISWWYSGEVTKGHTGYHLGNYICGNKIIEGYIIKGNLIDSVTDHTINCI